MILLQKNKIFILFLLSSFLTMSAGSLSKPIAISKPITIQDRIDTLKRQNDSLDFVIREKLESYELVKKH